MRDLITLQRTNINSADYLTEYLKIIEEEYNQLKPFLPDEIKSVLDIGCGMGGIDIFLYRDYQPTITFLDRDGIDQKIKYGYRETPSKYNILSETKKFVEAHGVNDARYINIDDESFPTEKFDLTISLLSMGYHYPLDAYKPKTKYLIADIRIGKPIPENAKVVYSGRNYNRIICQNLS